MRMIPGPACNGCDDPEPGGGDQSFDQLVAEADDPASDM